MLKNQSHLFDIPQDINFFNIASYSPSFKAIEEAGINAVKDKSHPYKIHINHFFEPLEEVKKLFAQLIDAEHHERVVTIPSVSYGMATVANNIVLKSSDEVLLIEEQFPSNYYIWEKLTNKYGATLKVVSQPNTKENCGQQWNEEILNSINKNTAVVSMGNVHWSNGTLFDLKRIREKTNQHNSLLIIDGSQSIGALPFSVKDIQPDALICAGYKWLFGPYGCAYAYYGSYFDNGDPIEENWINRLHSEDFSGLTQYESNYKSLANRYSAGEAASFIYIQMQIAALKQVVDWTPEAIQEYCKYVSKSFVVKIKATGCYVENNEDRSHHMFGIELPSHIDIDKLKQRFQKENIFISFRGNYLRVSCHLYNTKEEFETLYSTISEFLLWMNYSIS